MSGGRCLNPGWQRGWDTVGYTPERPTDKYGDTIHFSKKREKLANLLDDTDKPVPHDRARFKPDRGHSRIHTGRPTDKYGDTIHFSKEREKLANLLDDEANQAYYKHAVLLAISGLSHFYFGFGCFSKPPQQLNQLRFAAQPNERWRPSVFRSGKSPSDTEDLRQALRDKKSDSTSCGTRQGWAPPQAFSVL